MTSQKERCQLIGDADYSQERGGERRRCQLLLEENLRRWRREEEMENLRRERMVEEKKMIQKGEAMAKVVEEVVEEEVPGLAITIQEMLTQEQEKDENRPAPLTPDLSELAQEKEQEKDENRPAPLTADLSELAQKEKKEKKLKKKENKQKKKRKRLATELRKYRLIEKQVATFGAYIKGVRGELEEEINAGGMLDSDSSETDEVAAKVFWSAKEQNFVKWKPEEEVEVTRRGSGNLTEEEVRKRMRLPQKASSSQ